MGQRSGGWRFAIDRGGTFTDVVAEAPDGRRLVRKVLSEQPGRPGDPAVAAIRGLLALPPGQPIPPGRIDEVRLGTTVATNALLERRTAPVLLLLNRGFADLPRIGDQHRPDLFALQIERPPLLPLRVLEVDGRLAADGSEVQPLQLDAALAAQVRAALAEGYRSCAVALLHSCRNAAHERALGAWLERLGTGPVLLSHQVSPQPRLVPRLATCVAEAALRPVLRAYLDRLASELGPGTRLRVMTSAGVLQAPALLQAKDTILSGPAGGLVGAMAVAAGSGLEPAPLIGFDMGGTSTDVFHGDPSQGVAAWERSPEGELGGVRLQAPMLPIHTVAAGGGSLLQVEHGRLQVGPRSAGADPGPACYRRGGPATLTDANVLLGRLPLAALPPVFGPHGDQPADGDVVRRRFAALAGELAAGGSPPSPEAVADGALRIAVERMAEAIRRISIQRGHDLRGARLVSFGGAGGLHACALARQLGIAQVLLHPLAGVLSAYGIGLSRQSLLRERPLRWPLAEGSLAPLRQLVGELAAEAEQALRDGGDLGPAGESAGAAAPPPVVRLELRSAAAERGLELLWPEAPAADEAAWLAALRRDYEALHQRRFGYVVPGEPLVLERLQLELMAPQAEPAPAVVAAPPPPMESGVAAPEQLQVWFAEAEGGPPRPRPVPFWRREQLVPGQCLEGPALVVEATATTLIEPGWQGRLLACGTLLLEQAAPPAAAAIAVASAADPAAAADPVQLELYNHRFAAIAEQMGVRLQQSSRSVNIRERLDFSCAVFDGRGGLVANAPHIPVHLGSMGDTVASLLRAVERGERPPLRPGDAIASNDPFAGGTHLPDITVITPVFAAAAAAGPAAAAEPLFFVASRGHHADVGGSTPGSMPPFSHSIADEGLLLTNVPLLEAGRFPEQAWRRRLEAGPWPVRNPDRLLADLQAQLAANRLGEQELLRLLERRGAAEVCAYMAHVQANAAEAVRQVIGRLRDGAHELERDDGSRIRVRVAIDHARARARVDFSGTSAQQPGNANAPLAITRAVVLYVFRCLVGRPIPLNAGCFAPIELVVPPGCLLHPAPPAAVVAGNVETSQAVADALFAALGVQAAAQGTMNNLIFGNDSLQYYETICGGTGAGVLPDGAGFAGADAVQSHMTNSRLTDPEILEERFPVRLWQFAIRRGSGGRGLWPGGNGAVRELEFLAPLSVSLLSDRRRVPPQGLAGGGPGACGRNLLLRADGRQEQLAGVAQVSVAPGDRLRIETPGGGGWGDPQA
jgi:5-oxoprolinase (ATP-hydrolysing)